MNDRDIDHLLSKGRLPGAERERILENVIRRSSPSFSWKRTAQWGVPLLATGFAALLLFVRAGHQPFSAKGKSGAVVELSCRGGSEGKCRSGETLFFRVSGLDEDAVLAAYAERNEPGAERIWYFPSPAKEAPTVRPGNTVVNRGVLLGPEQPPGHYAVHLCLTRTAHGRSELIAGGLTDLVHSVELPLEIQP